jgi:hypothetical protein
VPVVSAAPAGVMTATVIDVPAVIGVPAATMIGVPAAVSPVTMAAAVATATVAVGLR